MKVSDIRRKLLASLAAGGLCFVSISHGANLNENLVVNGDFENVELGTTSFYNAPMIRDWAGLPGFAYSHDLSGDEVPDFANGTLPSGGHWYFAPGNGGNDSIDDALEQDIDVSAGATAVAISGGTATFSLSAVFSSYLDQADRGIVQVEFFNNASASLGTSQVATPVEQVLAEWTLFTSTGTVPVGTTLLRVASWGELFTGSTGAADGFTDNIDFRISTSLPADFDSDTDVDGADFLTWQRNVGRSGDEATKARGNANSDTVIDGLDLEIWKGAYGSGGGGVNVAAVPEPDALALAGMGLAALAAGSVRRSRAD